MKLAESEGHFLEISRLEHFIGRKHSGLKILFQPDMLVVVEHFGTQANVSHVHVHEDLRLSLEERIYMSAGLL